MPSIIIGGGNVNAGKVYADEVARQRQLAMQEQEFNLRQQMMMQQRQAAMAQARQQQLQQELRSSAIPGTANSNQPASYGFRDQTMSAGLSPEGQRLQYNASAGGIPQGQRLMPGDMYQNERGEPQYMPPSWQSNDNARRIRQTGVYPNMPEQDPSGMFANQTPMMRAAQGVLAQREQQAMQRQKQVADAQRQTTQDQYSQANIMSQMQDSVAGQKRLEAKDIKDEENRLRDDKFKADERARTVAIATIDTEDKLLRDDMAQWAALIKDTEDPAAIDAYARQIAEGKITLRINAGKRLAATSGTAYTPQEIPPDAAETYASVLAQGPKERAARQAAERKSKQEDKDLDRDLKIKKEARDAKEDAEKTETAAREKQLKFVAAKASTATLDTVMATKDALEKSGFDPEDIELALDNNDGYKEWKSVQNNLQGVSPQTALSAIQGWLDKDYAEKSEDEKAAMDATEKKEYAKGLRTRQDLRHYLTRAKAQYAAAAAQEAEMEAQEAERKKFSRGKRNAEQTLTEMGPYSQFNRENRIDQAARQHSGLNPYALAQEMDMLSRVTRARQQAMRTGRGFQEFAPNIPGQLNAP